MKDGYTTVKNYRTGEYENVAISGLYALADAIITKACQEYLISNSGRICTSVEHFLKSTYGTALLRTIDADGLIKQMKEVKSDANESPTCGI